MPSEQEFTVQLIFCLVVTFCFIAYRFRVPRWYMHGISMGVVFLLSEAYDTHGLVLGLGVWISLVGLVVFVRFLKQFLIEPDHALDHELKADDAKISEVSNASKPR